MFSLSRIALELWRIRKLLEEFLDNNIDESDFYFSSIKINNITIEGRIEKIIMNEFQFVEATLAGTKKNGHPADWQGEPVITTEPSGLVLQEVVNHNTVRFTGIEDAVSKPTAVNVSVSVDADLGEGVETQTATGILVVEPGRLTGLGLTFGAPQDKS